MALTKSQEQDLLREARENRDKGEDDDRPNMFDARDDLKFIAGEQWHSSDTQQRDLEGRPYLTINKTGQFVRQVTGDIRLNRPSIKVRPVDSGADIAMAKVFTGLIRNIEYQSKAQRAYITAAEAAARCGIGNFRIVTEFSDNDSFEQDIRIKRIKNPFAVLWDPSAEEDDRSDAGWCFVLTEVDKEAFKAQWPKASTSGWDARDTDYDLERWVRKDTVTVAEYWRKEKFTRQLAQFEDGSVIDTTDFTQTQLDELPIVRTREVEGHKVVQYHITDTEILEGPNEWLGSQIPIISIIGEEIHIGERTVRHGVVRFAKDPQRMYNYWQTMATETIALAPKSPFIATDKQIEGHESDWEQANRKNFSVLTYTADPDVPGPPQRNAPPDFPVSAVNMGQIASEDMKATTGIYDANLGARGNETSGRAISLRQNEGDVGTFVYVDNTAAAIEQAGRILVEIIPKVYDSQRIVRVLGEDDSEELVEINQVLPQPDENGDPVLVNDITVGKYDVVVTTGPSFSTKRMETADTIRGIIQSYPEIMSVAGDLLFKAMDLPGADLIAERIVAAREQQPPPDPKAEADAAKSAADAQKKTAEAEGQELDNLTKQLVLSATRDEDLRGMIAQIVQEQLQQMLNAA
jgi:hypothetical protein